VWRVLGISFVILGVIHVPLPQADFHNIRHHDGPGEVCVYHNHLLRWHPLADSNADVSTLHWHWFVPLVEPGDHRQSPNDERTNPASGPALHAYFGDWPEPDWPNEPVIRPDTRGRFLEHLNLGSAMASPAQLAGLFVPIHPEPGRFSASNLGAAGGLRAARIEMFHRWNC
jgi:hypothetical protein